MIYIYAQTEPKAYGGLNYIIGLFCATLGTHNLVRTKEEVENLPRNSILIYPRVFSFNYRTQQYDIIPSAIATYRTNAIVVGSFYWESPILPLKALQSLGLTHYLHVPSRFLLDTFRHPRSFWYPPPVKNFPKRAKAPRSNTIGVLVASLHGRKNIWLVNDLARRLPNHKIIVVNKWGAIGLARECEPNVECWGTISDDVLVDFYHTIDWFVVLSGGEGYCLPAREALKCGTPVIAPRHTTFLDLEGTNGLFLVNTTPYRNSGDWDDGALYYFPDVSEIAEIIKSVRAPEPHDVDCPIPSFGEWYAFWWSKIEEIKREFNRTARFFVKECPALFAEYPEQPLAGINIAGRTWARKVGGKTFQLCYDTPMGYNGVIIVPYHDWGTPPHVVREMLKPVRKNNPHATIVLWFHHFYRHENVRNLLPYYDLAAATTTHLSEHITCSKDGLVLPNPIGYPPRTQTEGDYWLVWGFNRSVYPFMCALLPLLKSKVLILAPLAEICESWKDELNYPHIEIRFTTPLSDDELNALLDNAKGYLCFDLHVPEVFGEASGKIPYTLRKGKPIVANSAPRTVFYKDYINLLNLPLNPTEARAAAYAVADAINNNPQQFIPHRVPDVNHELTIFYNFLSKIHAIKRGGK